MVANLPVHGGPHIAPESWGVYRHAAVDARRGVHLLPELAETKGRRKRKTPVENNPVLHVEHADTTCSYAVGDFPHLREPANVSVAESRLGA